MKTLTLSLAVLFALAGAALAGPVQATKDAGRDVGHRVAQTGRATGHEAVVLGKDTGHAVATTGRHVAHGVRRAVHVRRRHHHHKAG